MSVFSDYAARVTQPPLDGRAERFDEVVRPDGALRRAWRDFAEVAVSITDADLHRVHEEIGRSLADDGVTYSRPGRRPGPWRLDPVPLVLDHDSWAPLEVGLAQRAELLNAVLADLYGERRLLAEGAVPAAVVLGHAGYVRAVARPDAVEPRPLVLSATDLGRDATGAWRVLGDRAQAPSGLGYAMENRRVISRVLPELYREARLHRMEPYFWALRSALLQSASGDLADPRVVVLSPGTQSETAYDQAFIASTLGFPLVVGSDLVVRDGWVYLRGPGRLERVDVILRRVDAAWSDPLELRGESRLGVAGLAQAVRRGRVRVVNGLGAGVLENPGLMPYLPAACELLLGESLRLPAVPTWWCGEPDGLERVLDLLGDAEPPLVRTLDGTGPDPATLDADRLRELLLAEPHRYVGQERVPGSQAPTWRAERSSPDGGTVIPQTLTLRTFTLRYGSSYRPLVGGLASVQERVGAPSASSKDVWVLKETPAEADQGLAEVLPMTTGRAVTVAVPRVLEDMFWFGRYAERAEDALRLVLACHAHVEASRSRPGSPGARALEVLLGALRRLAGAVSDDPDDELRSVLLDTARTGGVAQALAALRESLAGVRDQLSPDIWRAFGTTDRASTALAASRHSHQVEESAGRMLTGILSMQGVTASMIRDEGWHMMTIGRSLERALQVCALLSATATERRGIDVDREVLNAVLVASESAVTHRRRYRGYVRPGGVLELLLMDATNPRSVAFALEEVARHLPALAASTGSTRPERLVAELSAQLAATDVAALVAIGGTRRPNLEAFLDSFTGQLVRVADAVAELHVGEGPAPRPFGALALVDSLEPALEPAGESP